MKVLLINPPWSRFFGVSSVLPPMGLCHIAAYVKSKRPDITLELYDSELAPEAQRAYQFESFTRKHMDYVSRVMNLKDPIWEEVYDYMYKYSPDVVGISVMTASYASSLVLSHLTKLAAPGCKVILGGKHVTALPELALRDKNVDYVIDGEGEITFTELIDNINNPENVLGVYYKDKQKNHVFTGKRPLISDLNELPIPVYLSANDKYDFQYIEKAGKSRWDIIGARGCPFKCSFCATEHQVRARSAEHILKEIKYINEKFGITHFRFQDDSFSFSKKRATVICEMLKETGFSWECNTRVDLLDDEMASLMKASNCKNVSIGVESVSKTTLQRIHKNIDPDSVRKAVSLLKSKGIIVYGYFMIGFPWENYRDMIDTYNFCRELKLDGNQINFVVPLPGTELFADLVRIGKIDIYKLDWTRFQQSSYYMNFSKYPDSKWVAMLKGIQKKIKRDVRFNLLKHRIKLFLKALSFQKLCKTGS